MELNKEGNSLIQIVKSNENPVDVNYIATKLNVHWITAYKQIMGHILKDLRDNHSETYQKLTVIPIKTTKGWIFTVSDELGNMPRGGT